MAAAGQQAPKPQGEKVRLLLVDETKTFSSTMRVGIFAGILKKNKMFDVTVKMVDVKTSYADPLAGEEAPPARYDVIVIVPKGIDDGSVSQVWIVTRGLGELSPGAKQGVKMLTALVDKVFVGLATAVGVSDDLYPGFLSALYVAEGWL
jgi:hypothetical protein